MVKIILRTNDTKISSLKIRTDLLRSIEKDNYISINNVYVSKDVFNNFIIIDKKTFDKLTENKNSYTNKTINYYGLGVIIYNTPSILVNMNRK